MVHVNLKIKESNCNGQRQVKVKVKSNCNGPRQVKVKGK